MNLEAGELLTCGGGETRLVITVQPYIGVPETKEIEALLMYPDGSMRWYSSTWLAEIMRKVGDYADE